MTFKNFPVQRARVRLRQLNWDGRWTDNKNLYFENQQELFGRIRWKFEIISRANARSVASSRRRTFYQYLFWALWMQWRRLYCHAIFLFVSRSLVRFVFMIKLSSLVRSASTVSSNTTFLHLFFFHFFLVHSFDLPIVCPFHAVDGYLAIADQNPKAQFWMNPIENGISSEAFIVELCVSECRQPTAWAKRNKSDNRNRTMSRS